MAGLTPTQLHAVHYLGYKGSSFPDGNAHTWYETELWIRDRLKDVPHGTAKPAVTRDVKPVYRSGDPSAVPGRVELKATIEGEQQRFFFWNKRS